MARVFLARVDTTDDDALRAGIARGLAWLGVSLSERFATVVDRRGRGAPERRLLDVWARLAREEGAEIEALTPGYERWRYQLSVGPARGSHIEADARLYSVERLAGLARLRWDPRIEVGGVLAGLADVLAPGALGRADAGERAGVLAAVLEVADPDLVVADGRRIALEAGPLEEPRHALGLVLVADDATAADVVWAQVLGVEAEWLDEVATRGFGGGELTLGGDEPLAFFIRRREGLGGPPAPLASLPERFEEETGARLPVQVEGRIEGRAATAAWTFLASAVEDPVRRERLKGAPAISLLLDEGEPAHDRVLAVGSAGRRLLDDVRVASAARRRVLGLGRRGARWTVRFSEGRTLDLVTLPEGAPAWQVARAVACLTGVSGLALPSPGLLSRGWARVRGWLRRRQVPPRLVHARRIERLRGRRWRLPYLEGPPLRTQDV